MWNLLNEAKGAQDQCEVLCATTVYNIMFFDNSTSDP